MWITQTYLGNCEPEASVFIYYLYENYSAKQKEFTECVQRELEGMGDAYNDKVSLLMPNPEYANRIESEVRKIPAIWNHVKSDLPGLLVTRVPLVRISALTKDCYFFPLSVDEHPAKTADTIIEVRKLTDDALFDLPKIQKSGILETFKHLGDCVELKPGVFGFAVDLKKLFYT